MLNPEIIIRRAEPGDAAVLCRLILENAAQILRPHYNDEQWAVFSRYYSLPAMKEKFSQQSIFVAQSGQELVGTIALEDDLLVGFYTRLGFTGQGIGKKLMQHIEGFARENGHRKLKLAASPEGFGFYLKNGWTAIEKTILHYFGVGFEEVLMEKELV